MRNPTNDSVIDDSSSSTIRLIGDDDFGVCDDWVWFF